ncbi:MAG: winged helix-turn-helix domain-containing protein [Bryobacterales bacterium]
MLSFGPFDLDPDRREILREGERFPLQAKPFDALVYLVQHRDRVVEKQELLDNVWPDTNVEESALFQTISVLRKALGSATADGERYIATIPGQGYRFVAKAAAAGGGEFANGHLNPTAEALQAHKTLGNTPALPPIPNVEPNGRRWRRGAAVAAVAASAAVILGAIFWQTPERLEPGSGNLRIRRLTSLDGTEWQPGWAADGRSFAYSGTAFGSTDIFVAATAGGDPLRRTFDPADDLQPRWSPDGRFIAFLSDRGQGASVYLMSPFEGPERKVADTFLHRDVVLLSGLGAQPWSPDSDSLLFPRKREDGSIAIWKLELSSGKETQLTFPPTEVEDRDASFSFDGRRIAFKSTREGKPGIWIADASGQQERRVATGGGHPAWSPDGTALYISRGSPINIWRLELESGEWSHVTLGAESHLFPTVAANGALAYSSFRHTLNLYRTNLKDGSVEQLTAGSSGDLYAQVSPDGSRIAFQSDRAGNADIWVRDLRTWEDMQLTQHRASDTRPAWSPDGAKIAFRSNRDGDSILWVVDAAGGTPEKIPTSAIPQTDMRTAAVEGNVAPRWSPDGNRIGFIAPTAEGHKLWVTTLDGEAQAIESTKGAINFGWYLDSERVILTRAANDGARETLAMNLKTGRQRMLHRGRITRLDVSPDGSAFSFCNGVSHANQNLFVLRLGRPNPEDGLPSAIGEPVQLTDGKGSWHVHNGGWFPDNKSVIYTRDTDQADIFLVENQ